MARIVYLITSYINPEQIVRLTKTLSNGSPSSKIVIHHDYTKSHLNPATLANIPGVHLIKNYLPIQWGHFSQVKIILHSLEWIYNYLEFDWIVLISGQDYPIQPLSQIEAFLTATNYDGFINCVSLESGIPCGPVECPLKNFLGKLCPDCVTRYDYQYYDFLYYDRLPAKIKKSLRKLNQLSWVQSLIQIRNIRDKTEIGFKPLWTPFSTNLKCYKGSPWFTVNYRCVQHLNQFVQKQPNLIRYYQRTIIPDEGFFPTVLSNNSGLKLCNDNKRFISWSSSAAPSPQVLRVQDFERIVASNQHFARKFDINLDAAVLDLLDQYITARSNHDSDLPWWPNPGAASGRQLL